MEVRIGVQHHQREITFETEATAETIKDTLLAAMASDPLVSLSDSKGRQYFVPTAAIAYVEVGTETGRKVGFIS